MLHSGACVLIVVLHIALWGSATAHSEASDTQTHSLALYAQSTPPPPVYRPPLRGAPTGRLGGGTRGDDTDIPHLIALAPDHIGLTISVSPILYWYLSQPSPYPIEFSIIDPQAIDPLAEISLPSDGFGIQALSLADLQIELLPDTRYEWFVALIPDPQQRSRDIVSGGQIERLLPSDELRDRLAGASDQDRLHILAEFGIWYDALRVISEQIAATPDAPELQAVRQSLLNQVDISLEP